jgi:hypothetical protein
VMCGDVRVDPMMCGDVRVHCLKLNLSPSPPNACAVMCGWIL